MRLRVTALLGILFAGNLFADELSIAPHVKSRLGLNASAEGLRKYFIYSLDPLTSVKFRMGEEGDWTNMTAAGRQHGYYIYHTPTHQQIDVETIVQISAVTNKNLEIVDQITVLPDSELGVIGISETKLPEPTLVSLDMQTIYYGSASVSPQVLAQARANEMARRHSMTHWGGGIVRTSIGVLAEGIGCGGPNCHTCTATNGTAAIGDGQAVSSSGMTYRCRLYASPGTSSGGGGGWGRRGRRR